MLSVQGLTYEAACVRLTANGYQWLAEGDWADVYASPDDLRVVRITPYDPAYLLFVYTCWTHPHAHLPAYSAVVRLAGAGYAVEMPRYMPGDVALRQAFMTTLQAAMESEDNSHELADLAQTLKRGLTAGKRLVPYLENGIDWHLDNVLLDGTTPKLVDGFGQNGAVITDGIACGVSLALTQAEIASFLQIPYHRRSQ